MFEIELGRSGVDLLRSEIDRLEELLRDGMTSGAGLFIRGGV